jgi:hypothetical protein
MIVSSEVPMPVRKAKTGSQSAKGSKRSQGAVRDLSPKSHAAARVRGGRIFVGTPDKVEAGSENIKR